MRGDNRQIQTAVLSGADSEEPLTLPLEAIELDAFRRHHEHDTFWCGRLLGGCGGQLTTKLYTDRVCHFAHHPGTDGLCGRRDRGVASADHLYVKAAASAWLRTAGHPEGLARFDFARPNGAEIGSVLDIRFKARGLRVHLDQAGAPCPGPRNRTSAAGNTGHRRQETGLAAGGLLAPGLGLGATKVRGSSSGALNDSSSAT